ncbi:MAG: LOG family protein [Nitrososphaeria archaeon]
MQIGIAAHSEEVPEGLYEDVDELLRIIKSRCQSPVLILGGYWGLMKHVVDRAFELSIPSVLVLPAEHENVNPPSGVVLIRTGMEYRARSVPLVRSSDVLIVLGGSAGTMIEALMGYAMGKEVFVLKGHGLPSDKLESLGEYVDNRRNGIIKFYEDVRSLAEDLCRAGKRMGYGDYG